VAIALDDGDPEAIERTHLELADAQVVALDVPAALETARRLEQAVPDTIRGRIQHAALAWALGDVTGGQAALAAALAREPADIDARLLLAELRAASGGATKAKTTFNEAMDRADVPLQIAAPIAAWLVERGDGSEAAELADRTTANVADVDGLVLASALERIAKRPDRAAELADRAAKLGAPAGRVALLRGEAMAAKENHAGAVAALLAVPAEAGEYVEARLRAAELLREDGRHDEAGRALDAALERRAPLAKEEEATSLVIARAFVDERRGDAVRAARRLDEALVRAPNDARLALARAAVDDRRGDWRSAIALAEKVLAREPRSVEALNFVGFVAADHGHDLPLATKRLQAAVALSPGSGGIVDSLGWVYFRAGDLARASAFLEQAQRLEPGDPEILGHLGDLYARRQERERALETYRQALARKPSEKLARELAERVRTLEAKIAAGR
jgi:tetratricopeptide (TPR) repeat protein